MVTSRLQSSPEQIAFDLRSPTPKTFETFLQNRANEEAVAWLRHSEKWPAPILAIIGPSGSGKSHLAKAFTQAHNARSFEVGQPIPISECRGQIIVLDDAQGWSEESLFILINMALNGDIKKLLLTDRQRPSNWHVKLPDLRSRLKNIQRVTLECPDESLLEPIIKTIFSDYGRQVDKSVVDYMMLHCERDISSLESDITYIEQVARQQKVDVTKRFVAKTLRERRV